MPNFKINDHLRNQIKTEVARLMCRRLAYATQDFPVSHEEIQASLITPRELGLIHELRARDINCARTVMRLQMQITRVEYPDLLYDVGLVVRLSTPVYVRNSERAARSTNCMWNSFVAAPPLLNVSRDPAQAAALALWANRAVREKRLVNAVEATVDNILKGCAGTADILARWPLLAALTTDSFWRTRFQEPPKALAKYGLSYQEREGLAKRLAACDAAIIGAQMLGECPEPPENAVRATPDAYSGRANDPANT